MSGVRCYYILRGFMKLFCFSQQVRSFFLDRSGVGNCQTLFEWLLPGVGVSSSLVTKSYSLNDYIVFLL